MVSDIGPQFSGNILEEFAMEWGFDHITSSPEYPQSNGKVESAGKTSKTIIRKATHARTDGG